ncbi:MAG TPA: hypothetical protein PKC28_01625 [Bdellovibrionales bacterium]|nr:hypothetical protein [Bdellovibrionales bacterium]
MLFVVRPHVAILGLLFFSCAVHAQTAQVKAQWMLERLTGVKWPADSPLIAEMTAKVEAGDLKGAAAFATAQDQFYSVVVKEMAAKMSTREESVRVELNDFTSTVIGAVRDEMDFRQVLFGNFSYAVDPAKVAGMDPAFPMDVLRNNNHYRALERSNLKVSEVLIKVDGQKIPTAAAADIANPDPAGILTSRASRGAHAIAGTNRRLVEYTFRQFMCVPIEKWADTASFETRIGRDIDRAPGGDPVRFQTTCKGCHTGMDGFRGAFAKYDYRDMGNGAGAVLHADSGATGNYQPDRDGNGVATKLNRPNFIQYAGGWVSTNDSFENYTNRPGSVNATQFGWRAPASDPDAGLAGRTTGVHAFGRLIANSARFSGCMAQHVWNAVCKRSLPSAELDMTFVSLGLEFESNQYNMKKLFGIVASHPKCKM